MNPMSCIRSASSTTSTSIPSRQTAFDSMWSIRRPGVATSTFGHDASALQSFLIGIPPTTVATRMPLERPSSLNIAVIC